MSWWPGRGQRWSALEGAIVIGEVGGDALEIEGALSVPVGELRAAYEDAIPAALAHARSTDAGVRGPLGTRPSPFTP